MAPPTQLKRKPMGEREAHIIKRMKTIAGMQVTMIAKVTERNKKAIYNVLSGNAKFAKRGPKKKLGEKEVNHLVRTLKAMIKQAKSRWEITLRMLKKRTKCNLDDGTVRKALAARKIKFRRLRSKPLLTKEDRRARYLFARKFKGKPRSWWLKKIRMHIGLKNFAVYTTAKARDYAAMRMVRGAYRGVGAGLDEAYVVLPKDLRFNPGAKSCRIAAGVGCGRVLLWHEVGKKWNGAQAASLYQGPLLSALRRGYPKSRSWTILEDNDPAGFKSSKGKAAKRQSKINVFCIPNAAPI